MIKKKHTDNSLFSFISRQEKWRQFRLKTNMPRVLTESNLQVPGALLERASGLRQDGTDDPAILNDVRQCIGTPRRRKNGRSLEGAAQAKTSPVVVISSPDGGCTPGRLPNPTGGRRTKNGTGAYLSA